MDIVLYNSVGCELDRKTVNSQKEISQVINEWISHGIYGGDKIIFEGDSEYLIDKED